MYQFLLPHVHYLSKQGYIVDVACSYAEGYKKEGYHEYIRENIPSKSIFFSIKLERNPFNLRNVQGLFELKKIINSSKYDLIWTNEPVMGVMTRLAARKARKAGTKVFYLVHGYHFFKGAPKKNWLAYPVENIMSTQCDAMCMICWEDYYFTRRHMPNKVVYHIDGIGFNANAFKNFSINRKEKRASLGIKDNEILILSVGELQARKNHEPIIRAIGKLNNNRIKYMICGQGELKEHLMKVAREVGIEDRFILTGHVYDIKDRLKAADIFVHPSQREGLGIAALEAMASGLPLVTSNVQGIKDYVMNNKTGFVCEPNDINAYCSALQKLIDDEELRKQFGRNNSDLVMKYDISRAVVNVFHILNDILNERFNRTFVR